MTSTGMTMLRMMIVLALALGAAPLWAQNNPFAPVARVNDRVITQYELDQRIRFFQLLNAPGNLEEEALDRLIDERLQLDAASATGVTVEDEQLRAGMEEFASRANLNAEQFIAALQKSGVSEETFSDFVRAGVAWRGVIRARFGPRAQVSDAEVDRALALGSATGGVRVLLSEIFLPANTPARLAEAQRRAAELSKITTLPAFAAAARKYSAAPSRGRSGRQDWIPVGNLPPQIRAQILTLAPGQVTDPIPVPNAIALFQLRDLEETDAPEQEAVSVEFARYFIPGGRTAGALSTAEKIKARVDTCDDLYGIAKGQPENQLLRDVLPVAEVSGDVAMELAKLDEGEVSTALTTGDGEALVFLMLCGRTLALSEDADREAVRQNLLNQRLASYASGYLAELRSDAVILTQ
ncbi:MAG: SurA N-terminal domain-containing protein [Rhodobacter sp.]|nr:SurA N-terminal domain-containing protein [Rhodobacter sp.]